MASRTGCAQEGTKTTAPDRGVRRFEVHVPEQALADLQRRIAATRWPSRDLVTDRSQGVQLATIQALASYWGGGYDWRGCEARLNALPQFTTEMDGLGVHFIHVRSPHPGALPLIITHGWPGSVIEMLEIVGPLTGPRKAGAPGMRSIWLSCRCRAMASPRRLPRLAGIPAASRASGPS